MKKSATIFLVIIACISLLSQGCLKNKKIIMDVKEFRGDYEVREDNMSKMAIYNFKSLNKGDCVGIRDVIYTIEYFEIGNLTEISFQSDKNYSFYFVGNLTKNFEKGDEVEITIHINKDIFQIGEYGNIWTIEKEVIDEGWDKKDHRYLPLPPSCIHHI